MRLLNSYVCWWTKRGFNTIQSVGGEWKSHGVVRVLKGSDAWWWSRTCPRGSMSLITGKSRYSSYVHRVVLCWSGFESHVNHREKWGSSPTPATCHTRCSPVMLKGKRGYLVTAYCTTTTRLIMALLVKEGFWFDIMSIAIGFPAVFLCVMLPKIEKGGGGGGGGGGVRKIITQRS